MNHFTALDWIIVLLYLGGVTAFGLFKGGTQASARDYFLSEEKLGWWTVALAIVATETSALTFISVPGIGYSSNLNFLQLALGYLIGRVFVAYVFLPRYYAGELTTAYALIEARFGLRLRRLASLVFMVTRVLGGGVRLYALAIPLTLIFRGYHLFDGVPNEQLYFAAILITAVATVLYVQFGGVRAVIWTDVIQLFIYLAGALIAVVILLQRLPNPAASLADAYQQGKFSIFNFSTDRFLSTPYQFFMAVIGGAFLSAASHGTDHIIVQRLFATNDLRSSQKALILDGVLIIFQFALFLFVGVLLYSFYSPSAAAGGVALKADEVFAKFIIEEVPTGFSGVIVAGLIAAAMSSLSGSVSSLASSAVYDFYVHTAAGKRASEADKLRLAKRFTFLWAAGLTVSAALYIGLGKSVVEVALSIASFTYGGLLGIFLLAVFFKAVGEAAAIIGFAVGIAVMIGIIYYTSLAWTVYTLVGSLSTILAALITARLRPAPSFSASPLVEKG